MLVNTLVLVMLERKVGYPDVQIWLYVEGVSMGFDYLTDRGDCIVSAVAVCFLFLASFWNFSCGNQSIEPF